MKALLVVLGATLASVGAQAPGDIVWRGESTTADALAAAPARAVRAWQPWATEHGYRLVLSDTGDVLLLLSPTYQRRATAAKEDATVARFLARVEETVAEAGRLLPAPPAKAPRTPKTLAAGTTSAMVRGRASASDTVVVIGVRSAEHRGLIETLAARAPELQSWATGAAAKPSGFTLGEPLVGAWLEDPQGNEEWNADNELVHRVAVGLIVRHARHLPAWLLVGLGWHVEERVMRSIYCFPYRTGFVSVYDHTHWDRALQRMFKKRRRQPFELAEVARWDPRAGYDADCALVAFGAARYLADHAAADLPPLLCALDAVTTEKRKVPVDDFDSDLDWVIDTDYRLPADEQAALFEQHVGEDVWGEMTEFFVKGGKHRARKKPR